MTTELAQSLFDPKSLISGHFNELVHATTNELSEVIIDQLKNVEMFNVGQIEANLKDISESDYDSADLDRLKAHLIKHDCRLLSNANSETGYSLAITDWYIDTKKIKFLK